MRNASSNDSSQQSAQFGHESKALYAKELYLTADSTNLIYIFIYVFIYIHICFHIYSYIYIYIYIHIYIYIYIYIYICIYIISYLLIFSFQVNPIQVNTTYQIWSPVSRSNAGLLERVSNTDRVACSGSFNTGENSTYIILFIQRITWAAIQARLP